MNAEAPPFDDLKVRQAVNYAVDPDAINRVQGGVIARQNEFLPPAVPGYEDTPDLYPLRPRQGQGADQGGRAPRATKVTVWGNPENPTKPTVEYYADVLNEIGLNAEVKIIAGRDVLHDDRRPLAEGADGLGQLVPGLPAPVGLHRRAPEPRQRRGHG